MSSNKHILYDQELTPPAPVWDKIAAALDEEILTPRKAATLAQMETEPPVKVWTAIAAQLESTEENSFAKRLYNMEALPPSAAWHNIAAAISAEPHETTAPVVNMKARNSKATSFFRYAAAALVIGILAFVVIQIIPSRSAADAMTDHSSTPGTPATPDRASGTLMSGNSMHRGALGASASELINVSPSRQPIRIRTQNRPASKVHENQSNALYAYEDHIPDVSNRYIMLLTPDGNLIRMSKKLSSLVCCVSGEEQDEDCKSQIRKWQEQLATSPVSSSTGNFMDVLNMVSTLNDNNGL